MVLALCCPLTRVDDGESEERKITLAAIQDLKFHMNSGKILFTEKGAPYELHPPVGTRESRIDTATKLLSDLRRASHLSVQICLNDEGKTIVQPNTWVFHYEDEELRTVALLFSNSRRIERRGFARFRCEPLPLLPELLLQQIVPLHNPSIKLEGQLILFRFRQPPIQFGLADSFG